MSRARGPMTQEQFERVTLAWLQNEGYTHRYGSGIAFDNASPDCARLRLMGQRIRRKDKYPPDQQDAVVDLVLQQAETLGEEWIA